MRHKNAWWVGLVALTMVSGLAVADIPDWDWQATFEFDSNGDVSSQTLDFSSEHWVECNSPAVWATVHDTNTSYSGSHKEIVRIDTANQLRGYLVQRDGYAHDVWEACAAGGQIALDTTTGEADYSCKLPATGQPKCFFDCVGGANVYVDNYQGWSPITNAKMEAGCGSADPSCDTNSSTMCSDSELNTGTNNVTGFCQATIGIYANSICSADH